MGAQIKEVVFTAIQKVEMVHRTVGEPDAESILVKNTYSLISPGTELALFTGTHIGFKDPDITWARYPLRPGYASVGTVVSCGSAVDFPRPGDPVLHYQPHADHAVVDIHRDFWYRIPPGMDQRHALFTRFGQIAHTAVSASGMSEDGVLVLGGGIVGNLCAQLFQKKRNRKAIVVDLCANRIELARACGIFAGIHSGTEDVERGILAHIGGRGVSTVVEASGVPELIVSALQLVNRLGEVVLLGSPRGAVSLDVYKLIHRKATTVIGAHESRYPRFSEAPGRPSQDQFSREVLAMIGAGDLAVGPFITDTVAPDQIHEAYRMLLHEQDVHVGVLIKW